VFPRYQENNLFFKPDFLHFSQFSARDCIGICESVSISLNICEIPALTLNPLLRTSVSITNQTVIRLKALAKYIFAISILSLHDCSYRKLRFLLTIYNKFSTILIIHKFRYSIIIILTSMSREIIEIGFLFAKGDMRRSYMTT
jgi:hypothetical protein